MMKFDTKEYAAMRQKSNRGFTLIEVMIVVLIVGILSAIAYPSYAEHIRRGHRADARAGLLQAAQYLERAATANGVYPTSVAGYTLPTNLGWSGALFAAKRYTISVVGDANTFTLTATRKAGTAQANDRCGNLTLTQAGVRSMVSPTPATLDVSECWNK